MSDFTDPRPYAVLFTSLNAVATTVAGSAREVSGTVTYAINVQTTGAPTFNVNVEGTLDGTNWSSLGAIAATGVSWQVDKPVWQIRANLTSLSGGTATVQILAV